MGAGASAHATQSGVGTASASAVDSADYGTDAPSAMQRSVDDLLSREVQLNNTASQEGGLEESNQSITGTGSAPQPQPLANPMLVVFKAAGISQDRTKFAVEVLKNRCIATPNQFEKEMLDQRDFFWHDLGISRKEAEEVVQMGKLLGHNQKNVIEDDSDEDESEGDSSVGASEHGHDGIDLSNTNALATALGLINAMENEDDDENQNLNLNAGGESNLSERIAAINATINSNNSTQQEFLSSLLSKQAAREVQEEDRRSHADDARRSREMETSMEMMEMLGLALQAVTAPNGTNSGNGGNGAERAPSESTHPTASRPTMGSLGADLDYNMDLDLEGLGLNANNNLGMDLDLDSDYNSEYNQMEQLRSQHQALAARSVAEVEAAVTDANSLLAHSHSTRDTRGLEGLLDASERGGSASADSFYSPVDSRQAPNTNMGPSANASSNNISSVSVDTWDLAVSSPFLEYSPDGKAVLNRNGSHSPASPMLALSHAFGKGTKIGFSAEMEYLRRGGGSEGKSNEDMHSNGSTFSIGLAALDSMSPLGVSCFGKEPFTWGVYDDRRTSASTQSATVSSSGILSGVCASFCEGDVISLVLDLDPSSLTSLVANRGSAGTGMMQDSDESAGPSSSQSSSQLPSETNQNQLNAVFNDHHEGLEPPITSQRQAPFYRTGCCHLLLNGALVHTYKGLDLDARYVMGVTLCEHNCVRLVPKELFRSISIGTGAVSAAANPSSIPHPRSTNSFGAVPGTHNPNSIGSDLLNYDPAEIAALLSSMDDEGQRSVEAMFDQNRASLGGLSPSRASTSGADQYGTGSGINFAAQQMDQMLMSLAGGALTSTNHANQPSRLSLEDPDTGDMGDVRSSVEGIYMQEWNHPRGVALPSSGTHGHGNSSPQLRRPAPPPRLSLEAARRGRQLLDASANASTSISGAPSTSSRNSNSISNSNNPSHPSSPNRHYGGGGGGRGTAGTELDPSVVAAREEVQRVRAAHQDELRANLLRQMQRESERQAERQRQSENTASTSGIGGRIIGSQAEEKSGSTSVRDVGSGGEGKDQIAVNESESKTGEGKEGLGQQQKLKQQAKDAKEESESLCVVCMDRQKTVVLFPCRHMCVCDHCGFGEQGGVELQSCPMCRQQIQHRVQVFT